MILRIRTAVMAALLAFLVLLPAVLAQSTSTSAAASKTSAASGAKKSKDSNSEATRWITYQQPNGQTVYLKDDRRPALYTGNFGDCLGNSAVNVSRFDAAYYKDNMTIMFHLQGSSGIANESVMFYIGVYAYGESRFDLTFNPCQANMPSLCPLNASVPIEASGIIPISEQDVANIPAIALSIPDFEGEAVLRLFANSTQTEIGCYSAVLTNGHTFSHPKSVGSILGIFTFVALVASFATAIYGEAVPTMRLHYAHSLSVGVVFAVFQHIFFTGALSVNWPSVLPAWWSNFAWSGGMIYSQSMQSSINNLIGANIGNTSQVGAAAQTDTSATVGGGFDIKSIYKRGIDLAVNHPIKRDLISQIYERTSDDLRSSTGGAQGLVERSLQRRALVNRTDGFKWYGNPVEAGLPLPGNYSGFAGTLGQQGIRASNAFMTGFLWFLILLVLLVAAVIAFKWTLEAMTKLKWIKQDKLRLFREHWVDYTAAIALRTCYIGWFMIMFLTIFQFTFESSGGVKAIAAIVFLIFLIGVPGLAACAIYYKKQVVDKHREFERKRVLGFLPWVGMKQSTTDQPLQQTPDEKTGAAKPFWTRMASTMSMTQADGSLAENIHDNDDYTMKFGWLTSRFRRTRWWFFAVWLAYEFLRAIFYGGASGFALAQVFGLLVIEFAAFAIILWLRPFEGRRLNLLVVYCLGFSKVASVALSAAFDTRFDIDRIIATVIGVVIIVIQGILAIITLIAIVVGAISSYMSVSRNHENFKPRKWHGMREKYFDHLDRVVNDVPAEPKPPKPTKAELKAEAEAEKAREAARVGFEMKGAKRVGKIEDEDEEEMEASRLSLASRPPSRPASVAQDRSGFATPSRRPSRAPSMTSVSNLPYGARPHRASWSTRDFTTYSDEMEQTFSPIDMTQRVEDDEPVAAAPASKGFHVRKRSKSNSTPAPAISAKASNSSLAVGGDVSGPDMIGRVPAPPSTRPRSGTHESLHRHGSLRNSRGGAPSFGAGESQRWSDYGLEEPQPSSQRASKYPLTPAQEMDEWSTPKNSREG